MPGRLEVAPSAEALADEAASRFFALAKDAIEQRGIFRVALSGGTTPRAAYEQIAAHWNTKGAPGVVWGRVHLFWSDERMVPPTDTRSNYGMARAALLSRVPIPADNVHPISSDDGDAERAAAKYDAALRTVTSIGAEAIPQLDLIFLGLGVDGHTASLFPGSPVLNETLRAAVATTHPETGEARVTLTLPVLNRAGTLMVLVSGAEKAVILERVIRNSADSEDSNPDPQDLLPIQRIQPTGTLVFLADQDAAPWTRPG